MSTARNQARTVDVLEDAFHLAKKLNLSIEFVAACIERNDRTYYRITYLASYIVNAKNNLSPALTLEEVLNLTEQEVTNLITTYLYIKKGYLSLTEARGLTEGERLCCVSQNYFDDSMLKLQQYREKHSINTLSNHSISQESKILVASIEQDAKNIVAKFKVPYELSQLAEETDLSLEYLQELYLSQEDEDYKKINRFSHFLKNAKEKKHPALTKEEILATTSQEHINLLTTYSLIRNNYLRIAEAKELSEKERLLCTGSISESCKSLWKFQDAKLLKEEKISSLPSANQKLFGEAFPEPESFTKELQPIILDYLDADLDHEKFTLKKSEDFRLFGRSIRELEAPRQALKAAELILLGNADLVESMVRTNPAILFYQIPAVFDSRPRLKEYSEEKTQPTILLKNKTLLQIAILTGKFNPREMKQGEDNYGIFERLVHYFPKDKKSDLIKQLNTQFDEDWEVETNKRTGDYFKSLETFANAILNIQMPINSSLGQYQCKNIVSEYRRNLANIANQEVTTGLIFSPEILIKAIEFFDDNISIFQNELQKAELYWNIGYGSLQFLSLDLDILKKGCHVVIDNGTRIRDHDFHVDNNAFFTTDNSQGLGRTIFVDYFGLTTTYSKQTIPHFTEILLGGMNRLLLSKNSGIQLAQAHAINVTRMQCGKL